MNERIVCAANKSPNNHEVVLGVRHYDTLMVSTITKYDTKFSIQGFITNRGRFVDRIEAWKIAERERQIIRRVGGDEENGGTLYSENLY